MSSLNLIINAEIGLDFRKEVERNDRIRAQLEWGMYVAAVTLFQTKRTFPSNLIASAPPNIRRISAYVNDAFSSVCVPLLGGVDLVEG
jgi:hypothetical protein